MDFKNIENLVFEGGGVKGYVYVQAIREILYKNSDFLKNIKRYAGSSAGSVFAVLLCLNVRIDDIDEILIKLSHINILKRGGCKFYYYIKYMYRFYKYYGISDMNDIEKLIRRVIRQQWKTLTNDDADPTFNDVYKLLKKEIVLTSTNMNTNKIVYFSHKLTPRVPLYKAIIASSAIPCVFKPVKYDFNPDIDDKNTYLLDGGVVVNYPIYVFDDDNAYNSYEDGKYNDKTLGFLILTDAEKLFANNTLNKKITGTRDYINNIINIITKQLEKKIIRNADWDRTVPIYVKDYNMTETQLTIDMRYDLNRSASLSIQNIFKKYNV